MEAFTLGIDDSMMLRQPSGMGTIERKFLFGFFWTLIACYMSAIVMFITGNWPGYPVEQLFLLLWLIAGIGTVIISWDYMQKYSERMMPVVGIIVAVPIIVILVWIVVGLVSSMRRKD